MVQEIQAITASEKITSSFLSKELMGKSSSAFTDNNLLSQMTMAEREAAAKGYEQIAELTKGRYKEIAGMYNLERAKFLRGEVSSVASKLEDFAKQFGLKYP